MELSLSGKTALITGGASGLGLETARYLAREGVALVIADWQAENLSNALGELQALGAKVEGTQVDVRDAPAIARMATDAQKFLGRIDILVASAGIGQDGFFLETKPEDWDGMLDINIRGVMNVNHAVAPLMVEQRSGSIINIASEAGKVGEKRMVVYAATKGAVISFSKALSVELGRFSVRVNAVCPGVTRTPMTAGYTEEQIARSAEYYPLKRLGEPEDIASMITFLASSQSSWITGQALSINGGFGRS